MIVGHYATVLLVRGRLKDEPLLPMLVASNLADFAWLAAAAFGLEPTMPGNVLDVTFRNMRVDMVYTHEPLGTAVQAALAAAIAFAVWRRARLALACAGLVVAHLLEDLVAGFTHHVAGPGTPAIGLGLYSTAPEIAILIEAAFGAACVAWYLRGRAVPRGRAAALYALFAGGALVWLPTGGTPLRALLP